MTEGARAEKITKPIQLLFGWLAGLFSINSGFLLAAVKMADGSFEQQALTIAAIVNVPLFLIAVFVLQTRFRPELQEDQYYSPYLSQKTNLPIDAKLQHDSRLLAIEARIAEFTSTIALQTSIHDAGPQRELSFGDLNIGVNRFLDDRTKIKAALEEAGAEDVSLFSGAKPPDQRVVAIAQGLARKRVREVKRLAYKLGFTEYSRFDREAEQAEESVLFGAYGKPDGEISEDDAGW